MKTSPLHELCIISEAPSADAAFVVADAPFCRDKSTFWNVQVPDFNNRASLKTTFPERSRRDKSNNNGTSTPLSDRYSRPLEMPNKQTAQFWISRKNKAASREFLMAIICSAPYSAKPSAATLGAIKVPDISPTTAIAVRRSMTLNAMRMTTEYWATGSERVFELAQNRLAAHQEDVVSDLLVYLMHRMIGARKRFREELLLRAQSLAAMLGISEEKVLLTLQQDFTNASKVTEAIQQMPVAPQRRHLDINALVENQCRLLEPHFEEKQVDENRAHYAICKILRMWENM